MLLSKAFLFTTDYTGFNSVFHLWLFLTPHCGAHQEAESPLQCCNQLPCGFQRCPVILTLVLLILRCGVECGSVGSCAESKLLVIQLS